MGGGGRGKWVMGIEEGTGWDEPWVLYGNRFDNQFHKKNILGGMIGPIAAMVVWRQVPAAQKYFWRPADCLSMAQQGPDPPRMRVLKHHTRQAT